MQPGGPASMTSPTRLLYRLNVRSRKGSGTDVLNTNHQRDHYARGPTWPPMIGTNAKPRHPGRGRRTRELQPPRHGPPDRFKAGGRKRRQRSTELVQDGDSPTDVSCAVGEAVIPPTRNCQEAHLCASSLPERVAT